MRVPVWLTLGIAGVVFLFGAYRLKLGFTSRKDDSQPGKGSVMGGGFYRMNPRTHILIGIVYLLLATGLVLTSFGWNPLSR